MRLIIILLLMLFFASNATAQDTIKRKDLSDLSLEELMNLTIYSASKKVERLNAAPAIATVLTKNDLVYYAGLTLIDVLKYVPGVEVSMGSEGFYRVSIRGTRKEGNILFLIDGKQQNDFYNGRALFDIPVSMIDHIEIVRGPGSALYGSNAVAGVINVYMIHASNITAAISAEGAVNLTTSYFVEKKQSNFAISAAYVQNNTPGSTINRDKEYDQTWSLTYDSTDFKTQRWNKDLLFNVSTKIKDFHLDAYSIYRVQGAYVGPLYVAAPDSKLISNQVASSAYYNFFVSDNIVITPKIYFNWNAHNFSNQETPDAYVSSQSGDLFADGKISQEHYDGFTYGAQLDISIKVNEHFDLLIGNVYEDLVLRNYSLVRNYKIVSDENMVAFGNYDELNYDQQGKRRFLMATFMQGNYHYKNWNVIAGLRYDDYSDFGQSVNPRIGVNYKAGKYFRIKSLIGKAFRAPTFLELYDNTSIGNEYGVRGNLNLEPETITSYELGTEFNIQPLLIKYNLFYIKNSNLIRIYDPHGSGSIGIFENIGDVQTYGHEAELVYRFSQYFQFFANFSQYLSYFAWNEAKVSASEVVFYDKQPIYYKELRNIPTIRLNSGLKFNYREWRVFGGINFGNPCQNNKRLYLEEDRYVNIPYYLQGNISVSYEIIPKMLIQISANNLGTKYSDPDESTNINAFGRSGLIQPGPQFLLNVKYDF